MATFLDSRTAVDAALDAQAAVDRIEIEGWRPRMRAGLHWGSPRKLGGDYLGVDVNVAARVADAAKPDGILVSEALLARIDLADSVPGDPSGCGPTAHPETCTWCGSREIAGPARDSGGRSARSGSRVPARTPGAASRPRRVQLLLHAPDRPDTGSTGVLR